MVDWSAWLNRLKVAFWPAVAAIFFGIFVYRQIWQPETPKDPGAQDVAQEWSESVGRLGITPVFPPEEDFAVGDIWIVIAKTKNDNDGLMSKGLRIGRLDLRSTIAASAKGMPVFADTVAVGKEEKFRAQPRAEVSDAQGDKITLSLAAFPGVTLSHISKNSATLGLAVGASGANRDTEDFEEIQVPVAETYGAPTEAAFLAYIKWCADGENKIRCGEKYARNLLAFGVTPEINSQTDGKCDYEVQIQVVTRVFLTREIVHRRRINTARGGTLKISADGSTIATGPQVPDVAADADTAARTAAAAKTAAQEANSASTSNLASSGGTTVQSNGSEINITEVFQRPVVFGYRAISLKPSK